MESSTCVEWEREKLGRIEATMKNKRIALENSNIHRFDGNTLFSTTVREITGLNTPIEQWILTGAIIRFVFTGIPALRKGYFAMQYLRSTDPTVQTQFLRKLGFKRGTVDPERVLLTARYMRIRGAVWGVLPIAVIGYVLHAKHLART